MDGLVTGVVCRPGWPAVRREADLR